MSIIGTKGLLAIGIIVVIIGTVFLFASLAPQTAHPEGSVGFAVPPNFAGNAAFGTLGVLTPQNVVRFETSAQGILEMFVFSDTFSQPYYDTNATVFLQEVATNPQSVSFSHLLFGKAIFDYTPSTVSEVWFVFANTSNHIIRLNMTITKFDQPLPVAIYSTVGFSATIAGFGLISLSGALFVRARPGRNRIRGNF